MMAFINVLSPLAFQVTRHHGAEIRPKSKMVAVRIWGPRCTMKDSRKEGQDMPTPKPKGDPLQEEQRRSVDEMLMRDVQRFRQKRDVKEEKVQQAESSASFRSLLETVLIWDFFLILGLLAWLGIALVLRSTADNNTLLDIWLGLWQPFIQPVLGVLMLGAIAQGALSFFNSKK